MIRLIVSQWIIPENSLRKTHQTIDGWDDLIPEAWEMFLWL